MLKNITPSEATKNALKAGTTADKVNEANVASNEDAVKEAAEACPVGAIIVE